MQLQKAAYLHWGKEAPPSFLERLPNRLNSKPQCKPVGLAGHQSGRSRCTCWEPGLGLAAGRAHCSPAHSWSHLSHTQAAWATGLLLVGKDLGKRTRPLSAPPSALYPHPRLQQAVQPPFPTHSRGHHTHCPLVPPPTSSGIFFQDIKQKYSILLQALFQTVPWCGLHDHCNYSTRIWGPGQALDISDTAVTKSTFKWAETDHKQRKQAAEQGSGSTRCAHSPQPSTRISNRAVKDPLREERSLERPRVGRQWGCRWASSRESRRGGGWGAYWLVLKDLAFTLGGKPLEGSEQSDSWDTSLYQLVTFL